MSPQEIELRRERAATARVRFFSIVTKWNPQSVLRHIVCDQDQPVGKKSLGKFASATAANLFLRLVRAYYVRYGDVSIFLSSPSEERQPSHGK